ncbi:MAG: peroxide stress protein YaaA [Flavobacteriaceae bacterium]|nr:peroxide stress protein YaaA [Flavobacteriaceae bacterium]
MKIVISPAKSLDYTTQLPTRRATQPVFLAQAEHLNTKMATKSKNVIKKLMGISDNLAELNHQRYQDFSIPFTNENARPAVYAFSGDVYIGLDVYSLPEEKLDALQDKLRILSGMYGLLKPLDLMQAYRLEMGTELKINRKKNLYGFWGNTLTDALNEELKEDELFINLASKEYFKAIQPKKLNVPVISPVFKDYKNGKLKIISFFAKKARGSMVRYIIDNNVETIEQLKGFNTDGYGFSEEFTVNENEPVFVR